MQGRRKVWHLPGSIEGRPTVDKAQCAVRWRKPRPRRIKERSLNYTQIDADQWERRKHGPFSCATGVRLQAAGTFEAMKEESF